MFGDDLRGVVRELSDDGSDLFVAKMLKYLLDNDDRRLREAADR
jgi:hypothetical protein